MEVQHMNGVSNENGYYREWEEIEIAVPWGHIAGKWWGPRNKQPILALHGWQDNAGTFDQLCPLMPKEIPILCIDLPGHGKSSHFPQGMHYNLYWDGIEHIRRIVKHFGWQKITLLGHSLGGGISFMYAATFPNDVDKYISIDISGPTVVDHRKSIVNMGEKIDKFSKFENYPSEIQPCFDYDEMINLVHSAHNGSITRESATILMKRGMTPFESSNLKKAYKFSRDLRLKIAIFGMFTLEQVLIYAENITCEVLNIRATPEGDYISLMQNPNYELVMNAIRKNAERLVYEEVPGTHHLHLNTPERIIKIITDFIK